MNLKTLGGALLSGLIISIGCTVFLSVENSVIGAVLFSIGLLTICVFQFDLFTGKVGYAVENKLSYIPYLILVWLGNLIGIAISATLINFTRIDFSERVVNICQIKLDDTPISIFILAIFCGLLMFIAVDSYKKGNVIALFFCVPVFILCGFEHCIANMFYFIIAAFSGLLSFKAIPYIIIMTFGNSVGGMLIPFVKKYLIDTK